MKLTDILSGNYNPAEWEAKGYRLPKFDLDAVREKTFREPTWVHFGGGNNATEQIRIQEYLNEYKDIIEDTLYGGMVHTFLKNSSAAIATTNSDSINRMSPNVNGLTINLLKQHFFVGAMLDWRQLITKSRREAFMVLGNIGWRNSNRANDGDNIICSPNPLLFLVFRKIMCSFHNDFCRFPPPKPPFSLLETKKSKKNRFFSVWGIGILKKMIII